MRVCSHFWLPAPTAGARWWLGQCHYDLDLPRLQCFVRATVNLVILNIIGQEKKHVLKTVAFSRGEIGGIPSITEIPKHFRNIAEILRLR
jgi:hypothetical protein